MQLKKEQTYLGDVISDDGKHTKNVQARRNKGLGVITQITQILDSVLFGKHFFEVAMVLRSSLFLSSILLNSEAWVNLSDTDIRNLERLDEMLLAKVLETENFVQTCKKYMGILDIKQGYPERCHNNLLLIAFGCIICLGSSSIQKK